MTEAETISSSGASRLAATNAAPDAERAVRERLGIPQGAERVLILGESSHWDPNWLLSSDEYYELRIKHILDRAIDALLAAPRRIYSIECVFFLKLYWDKNLARREIIRGLMNEGRLRLTGSGITTPDTVLPDSEAIFRDYLHGQEWLRGHQIHQEPRVAYLPDNFGNSPALPSILRALGVSGVAFARLDGGYFPGCDYRPRGDFPLPGSNAERLLRREKSLDFVWRDESGAEVLAHFHPEGYGQGDLLAHWGATRWMGVPLAVPARSEARVAAKLATYVAKLGPLSRTPYLFCPIGFDFVEPIDNLIDLLDRHNRSRYAATGVFVVNAALDDYFDLVNCHRERLPALALDPNPHWMGFTASRPALKRACRQLVDVLLEVDALTAQSGHEGREADGSQVAAVADAWFWATVSNHHDFITGTSTDRVHRLEQKQRIDEALSSAHGARNRLTSRRLVPGTGPAIPCRVSWTRRGDRAELRTPHFVAEIDPQRGACITRLTDLPTGRMLLDDASGDLVDCHDSGGLWRMGHEFRGGTFRERDCQSSRHVEFEVREHDSAVALVTRERLAGGVVTRTFWFRTDVPLLRVRVEGLIGRRHSLLIRFRTGPLAANATMDVPGGTIDRPPTRLHAPTFWAVNRFAQFRGVDGEHGMALLSPGPASVSFDSAGIVDCLALRNAARERAFGCLPLLGFPISAREREASRCDVALWFPSAGDVWADRLHLLAREAFDDPWAAEDRAQTRVLFDSLVSTDCPEAQILAIKQASRGEGIIVRVYIPARRLPTGITVRWRSAAIVRAALCDARERDLTVLDVDAGGVRVPVTESFLSVRLVTCEAARTTGASPAEELPLQ